MSKDLKTEVEVDRIVSLDRAERAFQKHKMVRLDADRESLELVVPAGSYLVRTGQPLGRWISYMLEANSDDGYAFWNFFDSVLKRKEGYSAYVFEDIAEQFLIKNPSIKKELEEKINTEWSWNFLMALFLSTWILLKKCSRSC